MSESEEESKDKIKFWVNVYKDGKDRYSISNLYATESIAREIGESVKGYYVTTFIEIEDIQ